jgi:glycolate oxidase
MLAIFNATEDASQAVSDIIAAGILPGALEMMDQPIIRAVEEANQFGLPTDAKALLIVELEGHGPGLDRQMERVIELCKKRQAREIRPAANDQQRMDLWKCRKRAFGAMGRISANFITQDGVVPRTKLPEALRYVYEISRQNGLNVGNVFHAGDGNLHPLIFYDERIAGQAQKAMDVSNAILARCVELGGSITGEHGIGVEKVGSMPKQFTDDELDALQRVRRAFDPVTLFNPGKIFPDGKRLRVQPTA